MGAAGSIQETQDEKKIIETEKHEEKHEEKYDKDAFEKQNVKATDAVIDHINKHAFRNTSTHPILRIHLMRFTNDKFLVGKNRLNALNYRSNFDKDWKTLELNDLYRICDSLETFSN